MLQLVPSIPRRHTHYVLADNLADNLGLTHALGTRMFFKIISHPLNLFTPDYLQAQQCSSPQKQFCYRSSSVSRGISLLAHIENKVLNHLDKYTEMYSINKYIYICQYVCIYVCKYIWLCKYVCGCMCVRVYVHTHIVHTYLLDE